MQTDTHSDCATQHSGDPVYDLTQLLVPPAILVVSVALGLAGSLHLGLSAELATAVGVSMFCFMLMCHVLLRWADEAERAADDAAERSNEQVSSPMPRLPGASPVAANMSEANTSETSSVTGAIASGPAPASPTAASVSAPAEAGSTAPAAWSFRPADVKLSETPGAAFEGENHAIADDASRIDAILKRLAHQIHHGTAGHIVPAHAGSRAGNAVLPTAAEGPAAKDTEEALTSAVDALRTTAEAMRAPGQPHSHSPPPIVSAEQRVSAVAEAIRHEQADVYLSPILGLAEGSAKHFEVFVHLRGADADARSVAAGAGLLPLLDALSVRHAGGFAHVLERRRRDGAVFSHVGGGSLESEQFVSDLVSQHGQGIASRMVLSFAQVEMRGLGPAQLAALEDLSRIGFRFALQGVADLDMDFEALQGLGFEFVKLDAAVFAGGLICGGEHVPSTDICRHFEDLGLAVIVSGIGTEDTRDQLITCGVAYGQGALFGPLRRVPVAGTAGTIAA